MCAGLLFTFGFVEAAQPSITTTVLFSAETATSVLRGPARETLTHAGEVVWILLRLAGPVLFALFLLSLRRPRAALSGGGAAAGGPPLGLNRRSTLRESSCRRMRIEGVGGHRIAPSHAPQSVDRTGRGCFRSAFPRRRLDPSHGRGYACIGFRIARRIAPSHPLARGRVRVGREHGC